MKILFFDTETTGLPLNYKAEINDFDNWPRIVEIAAILVEDDKVLFNGSSIIRPEGFIIPDAVIAIHGITNEIANEKGLSIKDAMTTFVKLCTQADIISGHNVSFDRKVVGCELLRAGFNDILHGKPRICTMMKSTKHCSIPAVGRRGVKWPSLQELHTKLFNVGFEDSHSAHNDIVATFKCFKELRRLNVISNDDIQAEINRSNELLKSES